MSKCPVNIHSNDKQLNQLPIKLFRCFEDCRDAMNACSNLKCNCHLHIVLPLGNSRIELCNSENALHRRRIAAGIWSQTAWLQGFLV